MELSRRVKMAMAFLVATAPVMLFDIMNMNANPVLMKTVPGFVMPYMMFAMNVIIPVVFLLAAYAIALLWNGDQRGLWLAIAVGAINWILNLPAGFWRVTSGLPFNTVFYAAVPCTIELFVAGVIIVQCFLELRERGVVARRPLPSNA